MAVEFSAPGSRTSEYRFLPEHIEILPEMNGRHDLPDISHLIQSIVEHGQLQPVIIRRDGGKPVLVAGFSRWRAVSEINAKGLLPKPIELRCSYMQLNEKQAFLRNIEENRMRNETTPMDDAYNIQRLINVYQMSEAEAAETYRASVSWVRDRLALIELAPEAEQEVRKGTIKPSAAKAIAKLSSAQQKALAKVAKEKGKITSADIRKETGEPPKPAYAPAPKAQPMEAMAAAMRTLLEECAAQPEVLVLEVHRDTIEALKEAWVKL